MSEVTCKLIWFLIKLTNMLVLPTFVRRPGRNAFNEMPTLNEAEGGGLTLRLIT